MNKSHLLLAAILITAADALIAGEKSDFSKLDLTRLPPAAERQGLTYAKDIRPLLETSCLRCHGEQRPKGGLQLNSRENVLKGGEDGPVVVPGDSKKSLLVIAAARIDDETAMPPKRRPGGGRGPGGFGPPGGQGGPENGPGQPHPPRDGNGEGSGQLPPAGDGNSGGPGSRSDGQPGGPGGFRGGGFGPPPKPLTLEQVGLLRAWIDQGAK